MQKLVLSLLLSLMAMTQAWGISFSTTSKTYQLINLTDAGQTATGATGTITYSSSNPKIVQVDANGALRFVNSGLASITATDSNGGATTSYSVRIEAASATYSINNGNTYELTGNGKLENKTVTVIPGITAQFGVPGEVTVVRSVGGGIGATTIDTNGYSFIYKPENYPTMGTFYKFTPTTGGYFDVWGYYNDVNGSGLKLTDENGTSLLGGVESLSGNQIHGWGTLEAGKDYYLYTDADNWFNLKSFQFRPTFYFETPSVRVANGTASYQQTVAGGSGVSYSARFMGKMKGGIDKTNGTVTMEGEGGAVEVTATLGNASANYVITVPYAYNEWKFDATTMPIESLKQETDWSIAYKTKTYQGTTLTYLNTPIMVAGPAVSGNNAHFIAATAGLEITAAARSFGATAVFSSSLVTSGPDSLDVKLNATYNDVASVKNLSMRFGTKITIPDLKEGQYVRVKWARHSPSAGDMMTATNLTDLDGKDMASAFQIGHALNNSRDWASGWMIFKVKADGDVSFTGSSTKGWTDINTIQVYESGQLYATDLRLRDSTPADVMQYYDYMISSGVVPSPIKTIPLYKDANRTIGAQNGLSGVSYSLSKADGVSASIDNNTLTVTSGYGTIVVMEKILTTNNYVIDKKEFPIAINKGVQTTISYPYTWDFVGRTDIGRTIPSSETLTAFGTVNDGANPYYWKNNNNGILGLLAVDETYGLRRHVAGSEMWINNTIFRESKGLRITLADYTTANNNQVTMGNNGALTVKSGPTQKITIPGVPANAKIYVHGKKQSGAILQLGTTDLAAVNGATDVYMAQVTTAGDATLNVADVDIYRIGVSIDDKSISSVGAATEARGYAVNYDYAQTFLGKQLKAYAVTGLNSDNTKLTTALILRVAAGTGVMLRPDTVEPTTTTWPLFTTDINDNTVAADNNKLIGVVTPPAENVDQQTGSNYNYMLSTKGYSVNYPVGATTGTVVENVSGLGFYLVLKQGTKMTDGTTYAGGKPKANSAYLQLPENLAVHMGTDDPTAPIAAKSFFFIDFASAEDPSATAIEDVEVSEEAVVEKKNRTEDDNYYTLYGVRVEHPTKGIYIHRGKKIIIK